MLDHKQNINAPTYAGSKYFIYNHAQTIVLMTTAVLPLVVSIISTQSLNIWRRFTLTHTIGSAIISNKQHKHQAIKINLVLLTVLSKPGPEMRRCLVSNSCSGSPWLTLHLIPLLWRETESLRNAVTRNRGSWTTSRLWPCTWILRPPL